MDTKFIFDIQRFEFSEDSGTASSPYIINTAADLKSLSSSVGNYAHSYFKLGANIDCLTLTNFTSVGTATTPFKENFELG